MIDTIVKVCSAVIGSFGNRKVFCWGGNLGESGCFGDSGSPLMTRLATADARYSLAGSVQGGTGPGCGGAGTYGLAWETAVYRQWYLDTAVGASVEWCDTE